LDIMPPEVSSRGCAGGATPGGMAHMMPENADL
jgi:hypothetical protein